MSNINIAGHMSRKSIVKDMNGNIITLLDESNGGYIIRNRQIVNPERWGELVQKEKDRIEASKAINLQKTDANAPDRTVVPSKVELLEKRINEQDKKLDAILAAIMEKK